MELEASSCSRYEQLSMHTAPAGGKFFAHMAVPVLFLSTLIGTKCRQGWGLNILLTSSMVGPSSRSPRHCSRCTRNGTSPRDRRRRSTVLGIVSDKLTFLQFISWLPDGYSQIIRTYVFLALCALGLWICYAALQNLIPSFP